MRTEFSSEKEKHNYFNRMTHEQKLDAFGEILASCRHVAFLGGAGVSTESGIPDFRSKNGLYRKKEKSFAKYKPEYLLSYDCLHKKPEVFFSYYRKNLDARWAEPNAAHYKLAELEKVIQELVAMGRELGEISDHPLALISGGNYSEQLRTELPHELDSYAESFNEMENTFKEVNRQFNQPVDNYEDLTGLAEIIRSANVLTSSPKQWYSSANRSRILSDLIDLTDLYTNAQKVKADLHKDWKDELFEQDSSQLRSEYDSVMSKWFLPRNCSRRPV